MSSLSLLLVLSASATQLNTLAESREIKDGPASSGLGSVVESREIKDGPGASRPAIGGELADSRHILITPDYRPPVGFEGGELRPPRASVPCR
jgi:hypothetical protein